MIIMIIVGKIAGAVAKKISMFATQSIILLPIAFFGIWFDASAQLASTQLDGLKVSVASIFRWGDARDLDCTIGLQFTGEKADRAVTLSRVKIIQAVDDTGMDLVRTNQPNDANTDWSPSKTTPGFWLMVNGLKSPAPNAKTIRHLEAETDFFAPTASTPILTNFNSRPGSFRHQSTLDLYQVKICFDREINHPPPPGSLIIDNSIVGSLAFQKSDGGILPAKRLIQSINGAHTDFTYGFQEVPPSNLNLVVYLATPEASERVRFRLDNIRLPWVDLPDFQASAEVMKGFPRHDTNAYTCDLRLKFTGGQLTNALGIRKLWINRAEDDSGQTVNVRYDKWAYGYSTCQFDALPPAMGDGRYVRKFVPLIFQTRNPKMIRTLVGEAELINPCATNGGMVMIKDFMSRAGESFDLLPLSRNHVKLSYLGPVNYAASRLDFVETNLVNEHGDLLPEEFPANIKNSLQFSLDDPDHTVIAPWGCEDINLLDGQGQELDAVSVMTSGKYRVYRFKTLPPTETQLQLYLAVPESLQRVPFKIEGIPLN